MKKIFKMVIILSLPVLGILTGFFIKYRSDLQKEYKIFQEGNIEVKIRNDAGGSSEKYLSDIQALPEQFLSLPYTVIIQKELPENITYMNGTVLMYTQGRNIYVSSKYYDEQGIVHEMFHAIDQESDYPSSTEEFQIYFMKYKDVIHVSDGNVENEAEFFASCGEMSFYHPDILMETDIGLYNYMESVVDDLSYPSEH